VPDQIKALVYLDAFVPSNGEAIADGLDPETLAGMRNEAKQNGDGYLMSPIPAEVFKVNERDAAWVNDMCVKHPLVCFEQEIFLTGAYAQVRKRTYVLATSWGSPPPSPFIPIAERLKADKGWKVLELPCGHDVMLDMPNETADILLAASV